MAEAHLHNCDQWAHDASLPAPNGLYSSMRSAQIDFAFYEPKFPGTTVGEKAKICGLLVPTAEYEDICKQVLDVVTGLGVLSLAQMVFCAADCSTRAENSGEELTIISVQVVWTLLWAATSGNPHDEEPRVGATLAERVRKQLPTITWRAETGAAYAAVAPQAPIAMGRVEEIFKSGTAYKEGYAQAITPKNAFPDTAAAIARYDATEHTTPDKPSTTRQPSSGNQVKRIPGWAYAIIGLVVGSAIVGGTAFAAMKVKSREQEVVVAASVQNDDDRIYAS